MTDPSKTRTKSAEGGRFGRLFLARMFPRSLQIGSALGVACCLLPVACSLAGCRTHDFPQYPPNYREYAYVSNGDSGTVSVYDVENVIH